MRLQPPTSTLTDTLALHDSLPIGAIRMIDWPGVGRDGDSAPRARPLPLSLRSVCCTACSSPPVLTMTITGHRRSEEHTSELQTLMRISYVVFCLKKNKT